MNVDGSFAISLLFSPNATNNQPQCKRWKQDTSTEKTAAALRSLKRSLCNCPVSSNSITSLPARSGRSPRSRVSLSVFSRQQKDGKHVRLSFHSHQWDNGNDQKETRTRFTVLLWKADSVASKNKSDLKRLTIRQAWVRVMNHEKLGVDDWTANNSCVKFLSSELLRNRASGSV